jgi:hypothetical protein
LFANLGHQQSDQNSFSWWAGKTCLLSDPGYEDRKLSRQHNTLSFGGVGQIGEGGPWWGEQGGIRPWGYGGEIVEVKNSDSSYSSVLMQAASAYVPDLGVNHFGRRVIWIKPDVLLVMDKLQLELAQELEANWLTELGEWNVTEGGGESGRLHVAALGTQLHALRTTSEPIDSNTEAHRLQTVFAAEAGTNQFVHLIWDEADSGLSVESRDVNRMVLYDGHRRYAITVSESLVAVSGTLNKSFAWRGT